MELSSAIRKDYCHCLDSETDGLKEKKSRTKSEGLTRNGDRERTKGLKKLEAQTTF